MAQTWDDFDAFAGLLEYPMYVVTARAEDRLGGCLVGFTSQTSIDPSRFLVCLSKKNHTLTVALAASHLGVHLVGRDELEMARWFGSQTGDEVDKFAPWGWHTGPAGTPILDAAPAWFVGEVVERIDLGDHVGHLLSPVTGTTPAQPRPWVTLSDVVDLDPGHEA